MKVILTEYVYKHGVAGDVVDVANGFARNYLIPRGLAIKATEGALRQNQLLIEQAAKRREELKNLEDEIALKIHGVELVFGMKAGKNNKLYGSVTTMDIARELEAKTGVDINRRRISERSLRELGIHEVPVRIAQHANPVLKVVILREEEVPLYLEGKPVASLVGDVEAARAREDELAAEQAEDETEDEAEVVDGAEVEGGEAVASVEGEAVLEADAEPAADGEEESAEAAE